MSPMKVELWRVMGYSGIIASEKPPFLGASVPPHCDRINKAPLSTPQPLQPQEIHPSHHFYYLFLIPWFFDLTID
ncbi:hypothetical protein NIES39_D07590 [Arthrospira platensis NIES-39]|nr:hypothetical protein NIES39_D07590 [Arthrospira platensis NIES-39]